jgi:hypothetical protein
VDEGPLAAFVRGEEWPITPARHERLLELYEEFLATSGLPAAVLAHAARNSSPSPSR